MQNLANDARQWERKCGTLQADAFRGKTLAKELNLFSSSTLDQYEDAADSSMNVSVGC